MSEELENSQQEQNAGETEALETAVAAAEPEAEIDNLESASAPEVSEPADHGLVPHKRGMTRGSIDPDEVEAPSGRRPFDDEPIDVEFEVHPKNRDTEVGPVEPKRLPGPDGSEVDAPNAGKKRRWPWWLAGAAAAGGGILALNEGLYQAGQGKVDPFPVPGGGGGKTDIMGGGDEYAPMSREELASRKPFHALSPEERIRFLRARTNQPLPSTLTRPY
mgnify:FL=1